MHVYLLQHWQQQQEEWNWSFWPSMKQEKCVLPCTRQKSYCSLQHQLYRSFRHLGDTFIWLHGTVNLRNGRKNESAPDHLFLQQGRPGGCLSHHCRVSAVRRTKRCREQWWQPLETTKLISTGLALQNSCWERKPALNATRWLGWASVMDQWDNSSKQGKWDVLWLGKECMELACFFVRRTCLQNMTGITEWGRKYFWEPLLNIWELITHGHLAEIKVGLPRVRLLFSSQNAKLLRILWEKYKEIKNDHIISHSSKYVIRIFYHMDLMHVGQ